MDPPEGDELSQALSVLALADSILNDQSYSLTSEQYSSLIQLRTALESAVNAGMDAELIDNLADQLSTLCAQIQNTQPDGGAVG